MKDHCAFVKGKFGFQPKFIIQVSFPSLYNLMKHPLLPVPLQARTLNQMEHFLLISAGAVLGANARYWLATWAAQKWGVSFPFGTLIINLSGSLVLGFFMTLATERFMLDPRWRLLFAVGFLGAYTTFSTYTFESFSLMVNGQWLAGLSNLLGSSLLGVLAAGLGVFLGKLL
jgi:fluoride exporter